jgi:arsenate reductase-like glutaredoxin family protein
VAETADAKKQRLGAKQALALAKQADEIVVARGKKVVTIDMKKSPPPDAELLGYLLGPTGNLRAPTVRRGKKLLVGFDADAYERVLGLPARRG